MERYICLPFGKREILLLHCEQSFTSIINSKRINEPIASKIFSYLTQNYSSRKKGFVRPECTRHSVQYYTSRMRDAKRRGRRVVSVVAISNTYNIQIRGEDTGRYKKGLGIFVKNIERDAQPAPVRKNFAFVVWDQLLRKYRLLDFSSPLTQFMRFKWVSSPS